MKSGVALALHLAATLPDPRYDVTYLFYEAEEIESAVQRARPGRRGAPRVAARPTSRCCWSRRTAWSRPAARARCGRGAHPRPAGAHAPGLARGQRDPRGGRGAAAAGGLPAADGHHRRLHVPGGAERGRGSPAGSPATWCRTSARSRSTCGSRPDRDARQALEHLHEVFDGFERRAHRLGPRRAARPRPPPPAREFLAAVGAEPAGEAGLDRRGPVRGAGHPGAQLRPG